jgi:serine/threonine protein kinase/Flp pilus assembly protein TadD
MLLPAGTRLGPYEIVTPLGAGGMGEVYKARDTRLDRTVAIKVLPPHLADDAHARDRFRREARAVASLNHPHICTLYDVGREVVTNTAEAVDFLVMEHIDGATLRGPLPPADALRFAIQIASALGAAHTHGILHRDLKPANIMLTKSGVKLLDFGLAKLMEPDADVTRTKDGTVSGTVAYMSPEQAEGRPLDARSDVFSFGAVLYELLSGRRAFPGDTIASVIGALLRDDPAPLQAPTTIERIVRRCLAKDPSRRFASIADVEQALAQAPIDEVKEAPSIAVLPFASMSPGAENEYFSDGISEEIINALTQIDGLHIAARTSSFSFKGKSLEVPEIARRLNVRHILDGSVRTFGNRVRVTAQLTDASNGFQIWSERYDRELADIFDVQDQIVRGIVDRLKVAFAVGPPPRLVKATTENVEAYQDYLTGRAMLYRRGDWITRGLESFQKAVSLDPRYAQAWAGIADSYTTLAYYGYRRPDEIMPAAVEAATRATIEDPESAEAHNALAVAALLWERDFTKADREFVHALTLNPRYIQARCWYGLFFLQWGVGRYEEGLIQASKAFEDDPLSAYVTTVLSFALASVGRFDEALRHARQAVEYDPQSFLARWELGHACHWSGRHDEAVAIFEPLWNSSKHNWVAMGLAAAYARAGSVADARALYESMLAQQGREYVQPFALAIAAEAVGAHEAAIGFCEEAIAGRDMLFALLNRWWPDFAGIRTDARFGDILSRFNARGTARER